jgi:RecJ-like exonuclease
MKVRHCDVCNGKGKRTMIVPPKGWDKLNTIQLMTYGVPEEQDCDKCGGTGHIIEVD